ncbi:MAG: hypothetical protein IH804_01175 [Planctomycetes bacterium]|nr:hypothetical protein [Planctomycetota bacterium]
MNSVDSHLINACFEAGIDPTSADPPKSIREAAARFDDLTGAWTDPQRYERWLEQANQPG